MSRIFKYLYPVSSFVLILGDVDVKYCFFPILPFFFIYTTIIANLNPYLINNIDTLAYYLRELTAMPDKCRLLLM